MKKKILLLTTVILCVLLLTACSCEHEWADATCTAPKTCTRCGETEGVVLAHNWVEASCAAPKTCSSCGATEGDALIHDWSAGTCDTPQTCRGCGKTEGTAPGHIWAAATCTVPETCTTCGAQQGETLPHTEGEEEASHINMVKGLYCYETRCTVCDTVVSENEYNMETMHQEGVFLASPQKFMERVNYFLEKMGAPITAILYTNTNDGNTTSCDFMLDSDGSLVAYVFFYKGDYCLLDTDNEEYMSFNEIWMEMDGTSEERATASGLCLAAVMMAINSNAETTNVSLTMQQLGSDFEASFDGINYEMGYTNDEETEIYLSAIIAK